MLFPSQLLITIYLPPVPGGQVLDPVHFPACGEVEGLTPVPLCSTQAGSRRGSPLLCWSSRNCMGSWKTSTHSRRGRHWRTGRRRTRRGRRKQDCPQASKPPSAPCLVCKGSDWRRDSPLRRRPQGSDSQDNQD